MSDKKIEKIFTAGPKDTVSGLVSLIIDLASRFVTYPALTNDYTVVKEVLRDCVSKLERLETDALGKKLL